MSDDKPTVCPTCKSGNEPWTITEGELSYLCVDWWHPECRPDDKPISVVRDKHMTIECDECGWKSDPFKDSEAALEIAQDHEDIEHEGTKIKWLRVH